jgi:uncharacterized caspase-like protein
MLLLLRERENVMWRHWLGIVAAVLVLSAESAFAQSRLALVIGNSDYQAAVSLLNPANDAKAVADALTGAGFEVTRLSNLTQADMRRAIRDFSGRIAEKGADTTALVYYAGHGVQVDGENFLIPVDARIQRESDIAIEALRLADIVKALETVQSRTRIVVLDACRNNPFSAAGASGRGLAIVDAPAGSIVAYSTAPGTEAEDGKGENSPYTSALLKVIPEQGLPIEQALKRVRLLVHESTEGRQTPWESSSLISDFEFYPEGAPTSASARLPQVAQRDPHPRDVQTRDAQPRDTQSRDTQSRDGKSRDTQSRDGQSQTTARSLAWREQIRSRPQPRQAYDIVVMEDSVGAYEEFLLLYPYDPLTERIRYLLNLRAQALAWRYAVLANTPDSYSYYLNSYPGGYYATQAMRLREQPRMRPVDSVMAPRVIEPPRSLRVSLPSSQAGDSKGGSAPTGGKQGMPGSATTGLPPKTDQKTGDKTDQKMGDKTDQKKTDQKTGDKTDQKAGERIDRKTREKIDRKIAGKTDRKIERSARKSGGATTTGVKSTVQKFSKSESRRNFVANGPQAARASAVKNSAFSRSISQSSFRSSFGGGGGHGGGGGGGGGGGRH